MNLNNVPFIFLFNNESIKIDILEILVIACVTVLLSISFAKQKSFTYYCLMGTTILLGVMTIGASIFRNLTMCLIALGVFVFCIVAFQQELREIIIRLAGKKATHQSKAIINENQVMIDSICQACSQLSAKRTGALIVIEKSVSLEEIIKTGVEVDAIPSNFLIRNIFFDNSPLHDGAIIMRNSRVYAVSCILPLSSRDNIEQDLGTRHRAAIGLSELSDAITIVVSEETGIISVAYLGELTRGYTFQELHDFLSKNILKDSSED